MITGYGTNPKYDTVLVVLTPQDLVNLARQGKAEDEAKEGLRVTLMLTDNEDAFLSDMIARGLIGPNTKLVDRRPGAKG